MNHTQTYDTWYTPALWDLRFAIKKMRPNTMSTVSTKPDQRPAGNIQEQSEEQRKIHFNEV